jgi:hypothetical protein
MPGFVPHASEVLPGPPPIRTAPADLRTNVTEVRFNNGPWQQFIPQPDGTLKNLATGLVINPNGREPKG